MVSIGVAARQSGVSVETIRYYERVGIMPPPARTVSNRRVYDNVSVARLRLIKRCRDLGFSLPDARALLALSEADGPHCGDVKGVAEAHLAEVRDKIAALRELEGALTELVGDCAEGKADCRALKALAGR